MNAPERIWAWWEYDIDHRAINYWSEYHDDDQREKFDYAEYIRADLVPQWQPIETAPSDHLMFYGNTRHDQGVVFTGWKAVNGMHYSDNGDVAYPKHWMPLPMPPQPTARHST